MESFCFLKFSPVLVNHGWPRLGENEVFLLILGFFFWIIKLPSNTPPNSICWVTNRARKEYLNCSFLGSCIQEHVLKKLASSDMDCYMNNRLKWMWMPWAWNHIHCHTLNDFCSYTCQCRIKLIFDALVLEWETFERIDLDIPFGLKMEPKKKRVWWDMKDKSLDCLVDSCIMDSWYMGSW